MSQNPTYEQESYQPYEEDRPGDYNRGQPNLYAPNDHSSMASYRQATTGPPPAAENGGKSYRYATEAIPEDEEAGGYDDSAVDVKNVNFTNGGQPTRQISDKPRGGFWENHKVKILAAIAILFAVLFIIMLGLYLGNPQSTNEDNQRAGASEIKEEPKKPTTMMARHTSPQTMMQPTTTLPPPSTIGKDEAGKDITRFMLKNSNNMQVELLSLGARINSMITPGTPVDIVLGFNTNGNVTDQLVEMSKHVFGAANGRICLDMGSEQSLQFDGQTYNLERAAGQTSFSEGGARGLYKTNYDGEWLEDGKKVQFTTTVNNAKDGLPGSAKITVVYTLADDNSLTVDMMADNTAGSADSLIDMCNSVRFNLGGTVTANPEDVMTTHQLKLESTTRYGPNSQLEDATNGAYDFSKSALINKVSVVSPLSEYFLSSYKLQEFTGVRQAAELKSQTNSKTVTILTNQPVVGFKVINNKPDYLVEGKGTYKAKSAVAILTHTYFGNRESMRLGKGATYKHTVVYKVSG